MAKPARETRKFKNLLALLNNNESAAISAWNASNPDNQINGTTKTATKTATKAAPAIPERTEPLTSQELSNELVAKAGMVHVRGRVYTTMSLIEAQVRVLKTGKPEVIRTGGKFHTKGVMIFRMPDGETVAVQNLGEPT